MYSLRPWTTSDEGVDREISQAIYPEYQEEPNHPNWFPARQLGAPAEYSSRYVVEENAARRQVAYATLWDLRPYRYRFDLAVHPRHQRQSIATQLLSQLLSDARSWGATGLQARVRDDMPEALAFIQRRGFHESHRMAANRIDIAQAIGKYDFHQAFTQLRNRGIEVTSLTAARRQDSHHLDQFYQFYSAAREGWPDPDPAPSGPTVVPFERLKSWLDEVRQPDAFFIAKHADRDVAFSGFFDLGTAVHPDYRGRGIATLLKAGSIADAYRQGFQGQTIATANPAMQAVLAKLGYKRTWSEIRLLRSLSGANCPPIA